jgi:putative acetyltransferase
MNTIKRTSSIDPDFHSLVEILDKELWTRYPHDQAAYDKHNKIENNNTVVVVYDYKTPIGCGCFKKIDSDTVEIKRMFVKDDQRGKGISKMIMHELEVWAKELGFKRIILETGFKQPEAIGLYERSGYHQIENYGPYIGMTGSLCMEKKI